MSTINYFKHEYLEDFNGVFHNSISISNDVITLQLSLAQFLQFVPTYTLPEGYQQRIYIQEYYNHLVAPDGSIFEDVMPFPEGDIYIQNAENYIPVIPE